MSKPNSLVTVMNDKMKAAQQLTSAALAYGHGKRNVKKWSDERFITRQHELHAASENYSRANAAWKRFLSTRH